MEQANDKPFAVSSEQNPQKLDTQHQPDYSSWWFQQILERSKNQPQMLV